MLVAVERLILLIVSCLFTGCGWFDSNNQNSSNPSSSRVTQVSLFSGQYVTDGLLDGSRLEAKFSFPNGVCTDGTSLYVADESNNAIRKISIATGVVTTLAGGRIGRSDGVGSNASFFGPSRIAYESGYIYVTDQSNHSIRRVTASTGEVITFAGLSGTSGSNDGEGTVARFNYPSDVTSDGTNLYVIDLGNHLIRKIVIATREVSTFAGTVGSNGHVNANGTSAKFWFNRGSGITSDGINLYLVENGNMAIRKIVISTRDVTTLSVTLDSSEWTGLNYPTGVTTDGTYLYITNSGNSGIDNVIYKYNLSSQLLTTIAGTNFSAGSVDGIGTQSRLNFPQAIVKIESRLYFADGWNHLIRQIDLTDNSVTTMAGAVPSVQSSGSTDGVGSQAKFSTPHGLLALGDHLYVVDSGNNSIRKVNKDTGEASTFAGGSLGSNDGVGRAASFKFRTGGGIATDGYYLYVTDTQNHTIRKVDLADATVSTYAGLAGSPGSTNGIGSVARFYYPQGIVWDAGFLYVGDSDKIRKIDTSDGSVTTVAGGSSGYVDATGTSARFSGVSDITLVGSDLFIAEGENKTIRKLDLGTLAVTTVAGIAGQFGIDDGVGSAATFVGPRGIVSDGVNLYVTDGAFRYDIPYWANGTIRKIVISSSLVSTVAGRPLVYNESSDGVGSQSLFYLGDPTGGGGHLAISGSDLYVTDSGNNTIRKVSLPTMTVSTLAGTAPFNAQGISNGSSTASKYYWPFGMASDGTNLFVADEGNSVIRKVSLETGVSTTFAGSGAWGYGDGVGTGAILNGPWGLTSDGFNLYTADGGNNVIRKIVISTGEVTTLAGTAGVTGSADGIGAAASFDFNWGGDITTDGTNLYVVEYGSNLVRKIEISTAVVSTLAGTAGTAGSSDGIGTSASFDFASLWGGGVTFTGGHLYVTDSGNQTIRKINTTTGEVTTFAGQVSIAGESDGIGLAAQFTFPNGISTDDTYLYVADTGNNLIRKIEISTALVSTYAGRAGRRNSQDGSLTNAQLNSPLGILCFEGSIFFTDGYSAIRRILTSN